MRQLDTTINSSLLNTKIITQIQPISMRYWILLPFLVFSLIPSVAQVNLAIESVEVSAGESFCTDVTVEGFKDILSIQFRTLWDTTLLSFDSTANLGVEDNGLIFSSSTHELRFTWIASDFFVGASLEDGEVLFSICFTAIKDGAGLIEIDENKGNIFENPIPPEIIDLSTMEVDEITFEKGMVIVGDGGGETGGETGEEGTCALVLEFSTIADPRCPNSADGSVISIVDGSSGNISYNWSTGDTTASIENLSPGIYTLTISDGAGCQTLNEIEIASPNSMTINFEESVTSPCLSNLSATVTGGTGPYSLIWNEGDIQGDVLSDLVGGEYSITATDANGCEQSASYNIIGKLTIGETCDDGDSTTVNDIVSNDCECRGETGGNTETETGGNTETETGGNTETETGGNTETETGGNTETETGGNTETETGGNTETETGGNTETENDSTVTVSCQAVETTIAQSICQGQSYEGYSESGDYTDTFKKADGCDSTRTLTLVVGDRVRTQIDTSICAGGMVAGKTEKGSYIDFFPSADGCDSIRVLNLFILPDGDAQCSTTSTIDLEENPSIAVTPNPVKHELFIQINTPNSTSGIISVLNIQGQLQSNLPFNSNKIAVPMKDLRTGIYIVHIETETGIFVKRILKI